MHPPERLSFRNERGEQLVGLLGGDVRGPVVVSCHGMLSHKDGHKHRLLAELLAQRAVACFRFDFAGCGESEGSLRQLSYSQRVADLQAAMALLERRGRGPLALFGSSMGGSVAYLQAARSPEVLAVASLAAIANPTELIERNAAAVDSWKRLGYVDSERGPIGRSLWEDSLQRDVAAAVATLTVPILVVHGDADAVVPCSEAHDLATAARWAALDLVLGADHAFSQPHHLRPTMARIATFLATQLAAA